MTKNAESYPYPGIADCYKYYFRRFFKDDYDEPDINDYLPDSYYYLHDSDDYEPDSDDDYDLDN